MTVAQALAAAHALGLDRLDAQLLLLHALGRDPHARSWLLAHDADHLSDPNRESFDAAVRRRSAGEPVAYIVGHKEFFGLDLEVDARVLVPRPDTETLVEWALQVMTQTATPKVLDLGAGSGAIALAIQHARTDAHVSAVDASVQALQVAQANAARLKLPVSFTQSNWFDAVQGRFDVVVSNPPYIAAQDAHLGALKHEPQQALVSGEDGLVDIRTIVAQARLHLHPGGWLLLEHGYNQAPLVRAYLEQAGFSQVQSRLDLQGIERCSGGQSAG